MDNKHLIAAAGMVLTNGDVYAVEVWLGAGDAAENWRQVDKEQAEAMVMAANEEAAYV